MTRRRWTRSRTLLAAAVAAYAVAYAALWPALGTSAAMLGVAPAAIGGWLLGPVAGLSVVAVVAVLNAALLLALGGVAALAATPWLLVALGVLVQAGLAVGLGVLRRRERELIEVRARLRDELAEREALAAAAAQSEERFRLLAEEALTGVYLIQDGRFQYVNRALAATFGYDPTEIIGRLGPDELTLPDDRPIVRAHAEARMRAGGGAAHYRFRGLRQDGTVVPVEVHGRSLEIDGRMAILGTLRDRGAEARAEAELHLRLTALEAAPTGIVVTDRDGLIEWANPYASSLTGYALDELRGRHTRMFSSGHQGRAFYEELWNEISAGRRWSGELINRRKDGSEYVEEMSITPVRGPDGSIERFVAAKTDVTERRDAERSIRALNAVLQAQLRRITALHDIDQAITRGVGLREALDVFLRAARSGLGVDAVAVFLNDGDDETLRFRGSLGLGSAAVRSGALTPDGIVGAVIGSGEPRMVRDREKVRAALDSCEAPSLLSEDFEMLAAAPMLVRGVVRGVVVAGHRTPFEAENGWLAYFGGVAVQGAIMVDSAALVGELRASHERLEGAYDATIEGWSRALDLRDRETEGHSRRVTEVTLRLAHAMGYPERDLEHVRRGALLHDIGKMGVPDAILQKPGPLSDEEWAVMRMHTTVARDLLAPIAFLAPALEIPYAHHERWDGSGYPEGVAGEEIPLAARIFAVADVYDALTSDRPYRRAWTREEALRHVRDGAGGHFDPAVVEAFLAMVAGDAESRPPRGPGGFTPA